MKEKVIIFGSTGTLGTYLIDELVARNKYEIVACGNRNLNADFYAKRGIKCYSIDISEMNSFQQLPMENVKAVVQLAGVMPSRMVGYKPELYLKVNTIGSFNVLEYCRKIGCKKYIFTQSHSDVAGLWNTGKLIRHDASRMLNYTGDHAVYIISKNAAVDLSEHYFYDHGISNVILRLPTIYSYRPISEMYVNGEKSVLAYRYLIEKAVKGESLEIWGDPHVKKDIVYVKDFCQMVDKAIGSNKARGFYNVATGIGTSLEDQIMGISKVFSKEGNPSEVVYRRDKPSQISYLYDISNAENDMGYAPEYSYIEMLEDMKHEMNGDRFIHVDNQKVLY